MKFLNLRFIFLLSLSVLKRIEGSSALLNSTSAQFNTGSINLQLRQSYLVNLQLTNPVHNSNNINLTISFTYQSTGKDKIYNNESSIDKLIVRPIPNIYLLTNSTEAVPINVTAVNIGSVFLGVNSSDSHFVYKEAVYCKVNVVYSSKLIILGNVIGWMYFVAWTVSFYPQVIMNFWNKSVIGLNFDFLVLNWLGFFSYSTFNVGLFWIKPIKDLYDENFPRSIIPVQLNDVIFSLHALIIVTLQLFQCCFLERGSQHVSRICWGLTSLMVVYIVIIATVAGVPSVTTFSLLDFIYYISYLKLAITLIKYIPQAYMNFKRKSTVGWIIGNVLLDLTGGSLSIIQMIILSYNHDDWNNFFTDPTKFGLGLFSILFDIVFIVQHYILYTNRELKIYEILDENQENMKSLPNKED